MGFRRCDGGREWQILLDNDAGEPVSTGVIEFLDGLEGRKGVMEVRYQEYPEYTYEYGM